MDMNYSSVLQYEQRTTRWLPEASVYVDRPTQHMWAEVAPYGQIQDQFISIRDVSENSNYNSHRRECVCRRDIDASVLTESVVSYEAILLILCWKVPPLWSLPKRDTLCLNDELARGKQQLRLCVSWTAIQVVTAVLTIARVLLQPIFGCVRRACSAVISQRRTFCCYFSSY